eukprot:COSAG05_NODE_528_length_8915_cov_26.504651_9_plen_101_part_00
MLYVSHITLRNEEARLDCLPQCVRYLLPRRGRRLGLVSSATLVAITLVTAALVPILMPMRTITNRAAAFSGSYDLLLLSSVAENHSPQCRVLATRVPTLQ